TKPAARPVLVSRLLAASKALDDLRTEWEQAFPAYRRITQLPSVEARQDANLLPRQALMVSYLFEDKQNLAAFSLNREGQLQWHALGQHPHLADHVEAFRLAASQRGARMLVDDQQNPVEIRHWHHNGQARWQVVARSASACTSDPSTAPACPPTHSRSATEADLELLQQQLSQTLLAPMLARHQNKHYRQWVVSPDGPLGALPWDLLSWRRRPVVAQIAVSQLPSLSTAKAEQQVRAGRGPTAQPRDLALLAIGNPQFARPMANIAPRGPEVQHASPATATVVNDASAPGLAGPPQAPSHWPTLPASELEIRLAAAAFPAQATLQFTGAAASKARLLQASANGELARARHVLFATHAWYHPDRPEDSRLVLSPDPAPGDLTASGLVGPADIMGLHMQSDLAVLSACNSARGDTAQDGRSQMGFAYALQVAGNRNALLALWPVRDQSTAHFSARFFHHVARGAKHAAALQTTKREFMRNPNLPWRAPQHWAGFVLVGM
ncbi:CHAT domain-containing protein, partial [Ideonella sp.]|uniref:CHAT domain-containing protein n=1 Tax=Ideonella sp. TaxID=1929293 RepID=UPI003BB6E98B